MRPAGEVRQALAKAAEELAAEASAATWRDMAQRANVGFKVARVTVENMARAGQLERVGSAKREHSKRWMALYAPACAPAVDVGAAVPAIDNVMRSWHGGAGGA